MYKTHFCFGFLGVDCQILPPCVDNLEEGDSSEIPGVNCIVDESFNSNFEEFQDFVEEDIFGETSRSDAADADYELPEPLTTPSSISSTTEKVVPKEDIIDKNEKGVNEIRILEQKTPSLEPVVKGKSCIQTDENGIFIDVDCIEQSEKDLSLPNTPSTTVKRYNF